MKTISLHGSTSMMYNNLSLVGAGKVNSYVVISRSFINMVEFFNIIPLSELMQTLNNFNALNSLQPTLKET